MDERRNISYSEKNRARERPSDFSVWCCVDADCPVRESSASCLTSLQCQEGVFWVNLKNVFCDTFGIVLVCGEDNG